MNNQIKNRQQYRIRVHSGNDRDVILCVSHNLYPDYISYEYFMVVQGINSANLTIPNNRQSTFGEELRIFGKAAHCSGITPEPDKVIQEAVSGAYDSSAKVQIEPVSGWNVLMK